MKERIFIISPLPEDEDEEKAYYDKYRKSISVAQQEQQIAAQDEEEAYYDRYGKSTTTTYYDEYGSSTVAQEELEETTIEERVIIIYEAPKIKVLPQENQAPEIVLTTPASEETTIVNLYPQPEAYTITPLGPYERLRNFYKRQSPAEHITNYPNQPETQITPYPRLTDYLTGKAPYTRLRAYAKGQSLEDYLTEKEPPEPYARLKAFYHEEKPAPPPSLAESLGTAKNQQGQSLLDCLGRENPHAELTTWINEKEQLTSIRSELQEIAQAA
jgi:hypothetical protein